MNRWTIEQKIMIKALKDPTFKKQLLTNPMEAVREFLKDVKTIDLSILNQIKIRVIEEKKGEWVMALPLLELKENVQSETELGKLNAGGGMMWDSPDA